MILVERSAYVGRRWKWSGRWSSGPSSCRPGWRGSAQAEVLSGEGSGGGNWSSGRARRGHEAEVIVYQEPTLIGWRERAKGAGARAEARTEIYVQLRRGGGRDLVAADRRPLAGRPGQAARCCGWACAGSAPTWRTRWPGSPTWPPSAWRRPTASVRTPPAAGSPGHPPTNAGRPARVPGVRRRAGARRRARRPARRAGSRVVRAGPATTRDRRDPMRGPAMRPKRRRSAGLGGRGHRVPAG